MIYCQRALSSAATLPHPICECITNAMVMVCPANILDTTKERSTMNLEMCTDSNDLHSSIDSVSIKNAPVFTGQESTQDHVPHLYSFLPV